jgi:hypothetical protein
MFATRSRRTNCNSKLLGSNSRSVTVLHVD